MISVSKDSPPPINPEAAKQVLEYAAYYSKLLGLDNWHIYFYWKLDTEFEDPKEAEEWAAETKCDPEYYKARIYFNLDRPNIDDLEGDIRHELLHCVTWQFVGIVQTLTYTRAREALVKLEEKFVTDLEMLPIWQYVKKGD